jgi:hypothetical protein
LVKNNLKKRNFLVLDRKLSPILQKILNIEQVKMKQSSFYLLAFFLSTQIFSLIKYFPNNKDFFYLGIDLFEDFHEAISDEVVPEFLVKKQNFSNPLKSLVYNFLLKEKLNSLGSVSKFLKKFQNNIELKKGNSLNILPQTDLKIFDMIFVDGGHSYETVKFELDIILKNIKDNCLVVCDDYSLQEATGVKKAIDESVRENSFNFKVVANRFACLSKK